MERRAILHCILYRTKGIAPLRLNFVRHFEIIYLEYSCADFKLLSNCRCSRDRNEHLICDSSFLSFLYLFPMNIDNASRQKEARQKKLSVSEVCRRKR